MYRLSPLPLASTPIRPITPGRAGVESRWENVLCQVLVCRDGCDFFSREVPILPKQHPVAEAAFSFGFSSYKPIHMSTISARDAVSSLYVFGPLTAASCAEWTGNYLLCHCVSPPSNSLPYSVSLTDPGRRVMCPTKYAISPNPVG